MEGMNKVICEDCGKTFVGGPKAYFCPECRKEHVRRSVIESNKRRRGEKRRKYKRIDDK